MELENVLIWLQKFSCLILFRKNEKNNLSSPPNKNLNTPEANQNSIILINLPLITMKIQPLGERVLVKPVKAEERTKAGIYIPEEARENKKEAIVEEIGSLKEATLKKGDRIMYGGYSSDEFEVDGEKFLIIEYKDVIARIE